jgi:hypothetical protein
MKLIGLSGHMGCGKNYIAEQIIYPHFKSKNNILIIGFGDQMKNELYARDLSLRYDDLYDHKTFETRNKLQQYGTENGREKYHPDIWIRGLDIQIETFKRRSHGDCLIIVCDVRFINEAEYIKQKGGILFRINSPNRSNNRYLKEANNDPIKYEQIKNHKSETELNDYKFDHLINNDDNELQKNKNDFLDLI